MGGHVEQRKKMRLNARSRRAYIEGMKRYQEQGVHVLIDGKEADDELWEKIFEIRKDGGFYMGDYILEDVPASTEPANEMLCDAVQGQSSQTEIIREPSAEYGVKKRLKEIRFDIVYHW